MLNHSPILRERLNYLHAKRIQAARSTCCWLSFVMLMAFLVWLVVAGWMFYKMGVL